MATCHIDRKHDAKGLCATCYNKQLRKLNPAYDKACKDFSRNQDPIKKRNWHLKSKYGITNIIYNDMCIEQQYKCLLCRVIPKKLVVDHCHKTGRVRGLLCNKCNLYLSKVDEDIKILERIKAYV